MGGAVKILHSPSRNNLAEIIESVLPHVCGYANASALDTAAAMPDSLYIEKRNYEPKKANKSWHIV
jgi:hypothetical protein